MGEPVAGAVAPKPTTSPPSVAPARAKPAAPAAAAPAAPKPVTQPPRPVMSAMRVKPPGSEGPMKERVKAIAADTALNALGVAKDALKDFQGSNRYFKFKALIVGTWVVLSGGTIFAACPGNPLAISNSLGARLVMAGDESRPVYMIKNEGDDAWEDVMLIVNDEYRAATPKIEPGGDITVTPKQLIGPNGKIAPTDLRIRDLVLKTDDG
jgi:hypothetical protein